MKRSLSVLALLALAGFPSNSMSADPDNEITVTFAVEKMTCATCPIAVRKAMKRVDGVIKVKVDYDSKTATVTFDSSTATSSDIGNASTDVGFPASVLEDQ